MTFNLILIQIVAFNCIFMLFQWSRFARGWMLLTIANLAILGIAYWIFPTQAGYISGGIWFVTILVPLLGYAKTARLVHQERFKQARQWAEIMRWLHPMDGMKDYSQLLKGLELGQNGQIDEAARVLKPYQTTATHNGQIATLLFYRITARWYDLLTWAKMMRPLRSNSKPSELISLESLGSHGINETLLKDGTIAPLYLRSLGETGDLNSLVQGVQQLEALKIHSSNVLTMVRMYALAFCGNVTAVQTLMDSSLSLYPEPTRQFWIITAEMAAGQHHVARDHFLALRDRSDFVQKNAIAFRLSQSPVDVAQVLTAESKRILVQIGVAVQQEALYGPRRVTVRQKPHATYALILANCLVFMLEVLLGGSDQTETLYRLGALVPGVVLAGEWWRAIAAIFLHAGMLHLTANMLGLALFGGLVEKTLGIRKFLFCYFFSGVGSMLTVAVLPLLLPQFELFDITVGASGAIMGMVGVEAAILLKGWRKDKAKVAGDRLRLILMIIGVQIISDRFTPQISGTGHLSGLILGFLAGMIVFRVNRNI
jgi:rhomboid protease GluP